MDPRYVSTCSNTDFDYGIVSKRRGVVQVATFSGSINLIYDFQSQQGFTTSTDHVRTLVIDGARLNVIAGWPDAQVTSATFTATQARHYAVTGKAGDCFISNENGGVPKILFYHGGSWRYISAEHAAPTWTSTISQGTTGSSSGTYQAVITYTDIWGNETNPGPFSNTVSVSSGKAVDAAVIASADPSDAWINLYLLPPDGSLFQFATSISNATGTISWTGSDATLLASDIAPSENFTCPSGKYVTIYENMLLVAGDPNVPDAVWASHSNFLRQFAAAPFFRAVSGDGQPIRGFGANFNQLVIAKADSLYFADGTDDETISAQLHNREYGILGQPSIVQAYQKSVFFSDDGIYADNSVTPTQISAIIRDYMRTLNPANLAVTPPKQVTETYRYYKKIYFSAREEAGAGENDTIIVWDYEQDVWTRYKGVGIRAIAAIQNADDYEYLYGGDASGNVFWFMPPNGGSPNSDMTSTISTTITAGFKTGWLHLPKLAGHADWTLRRTLPEYIAIYAGGEPAGSNTTITLTTRYYIDFQEKIEATFTTQHSAVAWPGKTYTRALIPHFGGNRGTFNWIKLEVFNDRLDEHFYLERIAFGFKSKPALM